MNVLTIVLAIAIPLGIAALTAWISIKNGPQFRGPRFLLSAIRQMKLFHAVRSEERVVLRAERLA